MRQLLQDERNLFLVNQANSSNGFTPLMMLCSHDNLEDVTLLVTQYRASVTHVSNTGATALFQACQAGHLKIVRFLLENKADLAQLHINNFSCLHIACQNGHKTVVEYLLTRQEIDKILDHKTDSGNTPVMIARQYGHLEIAAMLDTVLLKKESPGTRFECDASDNEEEKHGVEAAQANLTLALRLSAATERLEIQPDAEMIGTSWETSSQKATYNNAGRTFEGTMYNTKANKGNIAVQMTNVGDSGPGTMRIGIKFSSGVIFSVATLHKTEGHDFYLRSVTGPEARYGVFRTPVANYAQNPAFRYRAPQFSHNCNPSDVWADNGKSLTRTHSPTRGTGKS